MYKILCTYVCSIVSYIVYALAHTNTNTYLRSFLCCTRCLSQKNRVAPLESESVDQTVTDVGRESGGCPPITPVPSRDDKSGGRPLESKTPVPPRDVKSGGRPLELKTPVPLRDDKSGGRPLESKTPVPLRDDKSGGRPPESKTPVPPRMTKVVDAPSSLTLVVTPSSFRNLITRRVVVVSLILPTPNHMLTKIWHHHGIH